MIKYIKEDTNLNKNIDTGSLNSQGQENIVQNGIEDIKSVMQNPDNINPLKNNFEKNFDDSVVNEFYYILRKRFIIELEKVDESIAKLSDEYSDKLEQDIKRYKSKHPSEPRTHFKFFDRVNEHYFNKTSVNIENISTDIINYCKENSNSILKIIFKNVNEQTIGSQLKAIISEENLSNNFYINRSMMIMKSILFKKYKESMDNIIKKQQETDPDIPSDYIENAIKDYINAVERVLMSNDINPNDNSYIVSDENYMTEEDIDNIWREFIRLLEDEKSINECDSVILDVFKYIANTLDGIKNSKNEENISKKIKDSKKNLYNLYSMYRKQYDVLDEYLNKTLVNSNFKENILNNNSIKKLKDSMESEESHKYDSFCDDIIKKIFPNKPQKRNNVTESVLLEDYDTFRGEFNVTKIGNSSGEITKENYQWFIDTMSDALKFYYSSIIKKKRELKHIESSNKEIDHNPNPKIEDKIKNCTNLMTSIRMLCEVPEYNDNSTYVYYGILEKIKAIFEVDHSKASGNVIKLNSDHLNNFYKLMGRYPKHDDIEEYEIIYSRVMKNKEIINTIRESIESSLHEKRFYTPLDYFSKYMGGWFYPINPTSDPVLTVESDINYGKKAKDFLNKCFAYKELCLLIKDRDDSDGKKIALDIVGKTEITQKDIEKMFLCIHLNNPNLDSGSFRSLVFNLNNFSENFIIGQPFNMTRLTKQNYLNIYTKDSQLFVGTIDVVSYNKLRSALKQFGNFKSFIDEITSIKRPKNI